MRKMKLKKMAQIYRIVSRTMEEVDQVAETIADQ